tara:strand:- start:173 stop:847 length:675 start_codon:yes stop_codon:yes gene_type:complete
MKKIKNNPNHIAIIMDGNGTWSKKKGLTKKEGHQQGVKSAKKLIYNSLEKGIKNITLFALSNENLTRPKFELNNLFDIFFYSFAKEKKFLSDNEIKIKFIGNLNKLPKKIKDNALSLEKETNRNKKLNLFIALNYGGKQDIIQAVNKAKKEKASFEKFLFSKNLPEVDLLIRTGGFRRLSNFLLWQISYTELYFTNVLWPDFRKNDFHKALEWYKNINRKFGKS